MVREVIDDPLEEWSGHDRRAPEKKTPWHVERGVPVTLVAAILLQTGVFIWGASGLYTKVENVVDQLKTFAIERYTKDDARKDKELLMLVVDSLRSRDNELERRVASCESGLKKAEK